MLEFKFIDKIGFELEGAWLDPKKAQELHTDESFSPSDFSPNYKSIGEYVSKPLNNLESLIKSIKENYPDDTVKKCGFHVHVSLRNAGLYTCLMSEKFFNFFLQSMDFWGRNYPCRDANFWLRLKGENNYCLRKFTPDLQAVRKEKGHNFRPRRTVLNYCYGLHKTLECRLFPMFKNIQNKPDIDASISVTQAFLNCVEEYLENNPPTERVVNTCVPLDKIETENLEDVLFQSQIKGLSQKGYSATDVEAIKKQMIRDKQGKKKKTKKRFNYFINWNPGVNSDIRPMPNAANKIEDDSKPLDFRDIKMDYGRAAFRPIVVDNNTNALEEVLKTAQLNNPFMVEPISRPRKYVYHPSPYNNLDDSNF